MPLVAPVGHWVLIVGPGRNSKRAQLTAGVIVCIQRKFAPVTMHRQIRGPCGGPNEPHGCIGTHCKPMPMSHEYRLKTGPPPENVVGRYNGFLLFISFLFSIVRRFSIILTQCFVSTMIFTSPFISFFHRMDIIHPLAFSIEWI